jgi:hypothetical protein
MYEENFIFSFISAAYLHRRQKQLETKEESALGTSVLTRRRAGNAIKTKEALR